jgi:antirestriction protein ArdC
MQKDKIFSLFRKYVKQNKIHILLNNNGNFEFGYFLCLDCINVPKKFSTYNTASKFFTQFSLLHEMVHSTGHPDRLNRKSTIDYENNVNEEELIADLGAFILMHKHLNIYSYRMWCRLKNAIKYMYQYKNNKEMMSLYKKANKAVRYVINSYSAGKG